MTDAQTVAVQHLADAKTLEDLALAWEELVEAGIQDNWRSLVAEAAMLSRASHNAG